MAAQHVMNTIQNRGYLKPYRYKVYCRAKKRFDKLVTHDRDGTVPMFRLKAWQSQSRSKEKISKKYNWLRNEKITADSKIRKKCRHIMKETKVKQML